MPEKALRNERLIVPLVTWEKKQVDRWAREANLNTSDYVREKLGLTKARKTRNTRQESLENPQGDPENAVDVEELAKEIYLEASPNLNPPTLAQSRAEAKRRLMAANQQ